MKTLLRKPGPWLHAHWIRFQELNACLAFLCLESPRWLGKNVVVPVQIPSHDALKIYHLPLCMQRTVCSLKATSTISKGNMTWQLSKIQLETHSLDVNFFSWAQSTSKWEHLSYFWSFVVRAPSRVLDPQTDINMRPLYKAFCPEERLPKGVQTGKVPHSTQIFVQIPGPA